MKKIIPFLLALILLVGLLPISSFAAEEKCDVFERQWVTSKNSKNGLFSLKTFKVDNDGWCANFVDPLLIRAVDGKTIITRIEAKVGCYGWNYANVNVSSGNKAQNYAVEDKSIVSVTDINASEFYVTCSSGWIQFQEITVYYKDNGGTPSGDDVIPNERPMDEDLDEERDKKLPEDRDEDPGKRPNDIGDIDHEEAGSDEGSHVNDSKNHNSGGGSVLSKGYPEIIYGVGGLAVGFLAAMIIFRRNKSTEKTGEDKE